MFNLKGITEARIVSWKARNGMNILRISLGLIFIWFGILKFFSRNQRGGRDCRSNHRKANFWPYQTIGFAAGLGDLGMHDRLGADH